MRGKSLSVLMVIAVLALAGCGPLWPEPMLTPMVTPTPPPTKTAPPPTAMPTEPVPMPTPIEAAPTPTSTWTPKAQPTAPPVVITVEPPTPTTTPTPIPVITDWRGEYYDNRDLVGAPALVRNDVAVDFNWGAGAPAPRLPDDNFSVRWTRNVAFEAATYRFHIFVDDGARLWVDGQLLINAWYDSTAHEVTAERPMTRGTHSLGVEYYEHAGDALIHVWWEKAPPPSYPDWKGEYWPNRDLAGAPAMVRNDVAVDFDWGAVAPAVGLPDDNFSARWTRTVAFEAATYRFHIFVDDGARLWVDDQLLINAWYDSTAHEVTADYSLVRGTHSLRVEYYEHIGDAQIHLWWEKAPPPSYPDWKGEYWPNRDLSGSPALVRNDPEINFYWGTGAPAHGLPDDNFSARWTRTAWFDATTYRFHIVVDDGACLWVDDQRIIDVWYDHTAHEITADYPLARGTHSLRVEYYDHTGEAEIQVWWEEVPSPSYPDWKGEYWSNRDLVGGPALVRNDRKIDFDWGSRAPAHGLTEDNFSVRWSRQEDFKKDGVYHFYAWADDGIRIYVDGDLILDEWHDSDGSEVYIADLTLTGEHQLVVEYYEYIGKARVRFWWKWVSAPPTSTPTPTRTPTMTPVPTDIPVTIPIPTNTPTKTPMSTSTPTMTPIPTNTPTKTPMSTSTPTMTPMPTETPTMTPVPTETPTMTPMLTDTPTMTPMLTDTPTMTPAPTETPAPTPTATPGDLTLTGRVYDAVVGPTQGIAGATVSVLTCVASHFDTLSGPDGGYSRPVPGADLNACRGVTLEVLAAGYETLSQPVSVDDLRAQPEHDFALTPLAATPTMTPVPTDIPS